MIDVVKEATVVPLPLQFAMIAQRASAALQLVQEKKSLKDRHKRALENAVAFLKKAVEGGDILSGKTPGVYDPDAMSAFEATESAKGTYTGVNEFLTKLQRQLDDQLEEAPEASQLSDIREFFRKLGEWCLAQNTSEIERVKFDSAGS